MALTTTTSVDPHILAAYIEQEIRERLRATLVLPRLMRQVDMQGRQSLSWQVNRWAELTASGVDEDQPIEPQEAGLEPITGTVGEVGLAIEPTDLSVEVSGVTPEQYAEQGVHAVRQRMEADACALFPGVATSVGTSGSPLTLDVINDAITELQAQNVTGQIVGVLHPRQIGQWRSQIAGSSGTAAAFYATGLVDPRIQEIPGYAGDHLGAALFMSTHVPLVNGGQDYAGCVFTVDAFEMGVLRDVRVEPERSATKRTTTMVVTSVYGYVEADPAQCVKVISAAA